MAAQVLPFFRRATPQQRDWSQQELAEFYRVEGALLQAGVLLESERGLSDEGDPWFVFCRADNGEPFIHFARLDGLYLVDGPAFSAPVRGGDFAALIRQLLDGMPVSRAKQVGSGNVFIHPAALLIALVGAAFFHTSEAKAAEASSGGEAPPSRRHHLERQSLGSAIHTPSNAATTPADPSAVILSALLFLHDAVPLPGAAGQTAVVTGLDLPAFMPLDGLGEAAAEALAGTTRLTPTPAAWPVEAHVSLTPAQEAQAALYSLSLEPPAIGSEPSSPVEMGLAPPDVLQGAERVADASDGGVQPIYLAQLVAPVAETSDAVAALVSAGTPLSVLLALLQKGVPHVEVLPQGLREAIHEGEHLDALPGVVPSVPSPPGAPETPSQGAPTSPVSEAPPAEVADLTFDGVIAAFIAQVGALEVIMEHQRVVLFDEDIFNPFMTEVNLASVTFAFADGSSVSLVGAASDLAQLGWLGH